MKYFYCCLFLYKVFFLSACSSNLNTIEQVNNTSETKIFSNPMEQHDLVVAQAISDYLDFPVSVSSDDVYQYESWILVCGKPLDLNGQQLDYSKTSLSDQAVGGILDDYFCALTEHDGKSNNSILRELVVGDTDSPIFDWIEKYDLPDSIFDVE